VTKNASQITGEADGTKAGRIIGLIAQVLQYFLSELRTDSEL